MALIDTVPTSRVTVPTFLVGAPNGELPSEWLRSWDEDGKMFLPVSYAFQALYLGAVGVGITVSHRRADSTGRFRTLQRQYEMLHERYVPYYISGARDTNYVPAHYFQGKYYAAAMWYLKPGNAMAATPGKSNHGYGLADDMASDVNADNVPEGLNDTLLMWLRDNSVAYGIGLETRSERWHWHWIGGDTLSQRVVNTLTAAGVAIPDLRKFKFTVPGATLPPVVTPPPTGADPIPKATLKEGDSGVEVFKLINALKWNRWYPTEHMGDENDSKFGARTKAGVMNMQTALREKGWYTKPIDGEYGPASEAALRKFVEEQNKPPTSGPPAGWEAPPTVRPGDTGPLVQLVQNALIRDGFLRDTEGNRDGVYGPATQEVVKEFQGRHGLEQDAIVGPKTWWALINGGIQK